MRVLVSAASKHGATAEIADRIAAALRDALPGGTDVDVVAAENVTTVDGYEAVVLGSAVYMGRWLDSARRLAETHAAELSTRPVCCSPVARSAPDGDFRDWAAIDAWAHGIADELP